MILSENSGRRSKRSDSQCGQEDERRESKLHSVEKSSRSLRIEPPQPRDKEIGPVDVWSGHSIQRDPN
jgi:hypothetical protein